MALVFWQKEEATNMAKTVLFASSNKIAEERKSGTAVGMPGKALWERKQAEVSELVGGLCLRGQHKISFSLSEWQGPGTWSIVHCFPSKVAWDWSALDLPWWCK